MRVPAVSPYKVISAEAKGQMIGELFWPELPEWVRAYLEANDLDEDTVRHVSWDPQERIITRLMLVETEPA